ncbi:unnamed protein product [Paramecium sonneborni]|uniref:Uncharacterized protein n=1 Tax=Paramecium sonneborni TaxID=65129 RepID=A0A8S1K5R4_9CILI|nr:unnamed protein product [Paramecium sonneborni]
MIRVILILKINHLHLIEQCEKGNKLIYYNNNPRVKLSFGKLFAILGTHNILEYFHQPSEIYFLMKISNMLFNLFQYIKNQLNFIQIQNAHLGNDKQFKMGCIEFQKNFDLSMEYLVKVKKKESTEKLKFMTKILDHIQFQAFLLKMNHNILDQNKLICQKVKSYHHKMVTVKNGEKEIQDIYNQQFYDTWYLEISNKSYFKDLVRLENIILKKILIFSKNISRSYMKKLTIYILKNIEQIQREKLQCSINKQSLNYILQLQIFIKKVVRLRKYQSIFQFKKQRMEFGYL